MNYCFSTITFAITININHRYKKLSTIGKDKAHVVLTHQNLNRKVSVQYKTSK